MVAVFHSNDDNALIRKREFVDFVDHTRDAISGYRDCFRVPLMCCCLFVRMYLLYVVCLVVSSGFRVSFCGVGHLWNFVVWYLRKRVVT